MASQRLLKNPNATNSSVRGNPQGPPFKPKAMLVPAKAKRAKIGTRNRPTRGGKENARFNYLVIMTCLTRIKLLARAENTDSIKQYQNQYIGKML